MLPAIVMVSSSPLQTRFICFAISAGMGWPSAEPETIVHSPCNWARAFFAASLSSPKLVESATAKRAVRRVVRIRFIGIWLNVGVYRLQDTISFLRYSCIQWDIFRRIDLIGF